MGKNSLMTFIRISFLGNDEKIFYNYNEKIMTISNTQSSEMVFYQSTVKCGL